MNKLAKTFKATPTFIGAFDELPPTANIGDICIVHNKEYIYAIDWQEISFVIETKPDTIRIENETLIFDF